jgi:hypothetical protein
VAKILMPDGSKKSFPGVVFVGGKYYARIHTSDGYRYVSGGEATPEAAHRRYVAVKRGEVEIPPRKNQRHKAKTSLNEAMLQALERAAAGRGVSDEDDTAFAFNRQEFRLTQSEAVWVERIPLAKYHWLTTCKRCSVDVTFVRWAHDTTTPVVRFCGACQADEGKRAEVVEDVADEGVDLV